MNIVLPVPDFIMLRTVQNTFATYGKLVLPSDLDTQLFATLERPWVDADGNGHRDPNVSCFVAGWYRLIRAFSEKHGTEVWWWCGVPDVSHAPQFSDPSVTTSQIHVANAPDELEGCVGIGTNRGLVQRKQDASPLPGIINSADALKAFMQMTQDKDHLWIQVVDAFKEDA